jgi:NAD(P)-dependent dehydrogenase (short-subunit alcohol dehydrogenase family)
MRRVFITGGTGSIGSALVAAFSAAGHAVTFQFRAEAELAGALEKRTGARAIACDLATIDETTGLKDEVSRCDVLVNGAGINICHDETKDVSLADWNETIAINLTAAFLMTRFALTGMVARNWGRIVNISSVCGLRAIAHNLPYTVSKHALTGLTKTVAREYGGRGITCNEVCPGPARSRLLARIAADSRDKLGIPETAFYKAREDAIPAHRLAEPDDIAACVLFLASDAAGYVNGVSMPVDGGLIT